MTQCHPAVIAAIVFVCIGLLLMVILLPLSFHRVAFDEAAIYYDAVTRELGTQPLEEGVHQLGPSATLLIFKTTQRTAEITGLGAVTADGIDVEIDAQVAYTVNVPEIRTVVDIFTDQKSHDQFLYALSAKVVRDTAITFGVSSFFLQREEFQSALQAAVERAFADFDVHATMQIVQVVNIELPKTVEDTLQDTTVAQQDVQNAYTERSQNVQSAEIKLNLTKQEADLTILSADRDVDRINQNSLQAVLAERNRILKRTYAFGNISAGLEQSGDFFVNSYLKSLVLQGNKGKTVIGI